MPAYLLHVARFKRLADYELMMSESLLVEDNGFCSGTTKVNFSVCFSPLQTSRPNGVAYSINFSSQPAQTLGKLITFYSCFSLSVV